MEIIKLKNSSTEKVAKKAADVLASGGLIIYPTETVYGLGVDATNAKAVEKLLRYKSRREGKPLSIAVTNQAMAEQYVELTDQAKQLYKQFLPGPYTIVSRGKGKLAPGVESEFKTLGVRIPDFPLISQIAEKSGKPFTATSANASGEKRPYSLSDIFDRISDQQKALIDLVIDAGTLPKNEPSTVIDTTLSTPLTVRGAWSEAADQVFETHSDQETRDLAGKLILKYWNQVKEKGLLIALNGELGAGKTVFTSGIAKFLQITQAMSSPTYTYINEYDYSRHGTSGKLYHLDMWKVDNSAEFSQLATDQLLKPGSVVTVEWWQQVASLWPKNQQPTLLLNLEEIDETSRKIAVKENI